MKPRLRNGLGAAVWLGLVAGLVELAVLGWRKYVGHTFLQLSQDIVWLTPLANVLLALSALVVLRAAAVAAPRLWTDRVRLAVTLTALSGSLLSLAGGFSKWAILILALGIGVQGSRLLAVRAEGFGRFVRVSLPVLAGLVVLAGAGGAARRAWRERRAAAALPAPPSGAPNVLLIVWDVVRAGSVSANGYSRPTTPHLARWAEGGVRFSAASAPSSWTLPSHAAMFTGRHAYELSADWNRPLDERDPTLAERFTRLGYRTGGFVGNTAMCSYEGGLPRGFVTYEDYRVSPGELARSLAAVRSLKRWWRFTRLTGHHEQLGRRSARQVNARFLRWLDQDGTRPFFAFVNYFDAHDPYLPRAPFDTMFGPVLLRQDPELGQETAWTPGGLQAERDSYERAIAGLDADFGMLLEALERRGVLGRTLVIVAADHGEEFGEHGAVDHGRTLYLPAIHVPLILRFPGRLPEGMVIDRPVSLTDLPATVQSLTGLPTLEMPGRSLEALWSTATAEPGAVISWVSHRPRFTVLDSATHGDIWALRANGWRYIRNRDREELYFLPEDPTESRNLADSPLGAAVMPALRRAVDSVAAVRGVRGLDFGR